MDLDKLNFLPQWEDHGYHFGEEGEEWKFATGKKAAKALYLQWRELFGLIIAFAENIGEDSDNDGVEKEEQVTKKFICENAMMVAPKIISAASGGMYIVQMENAAIIRTNCRQLMEQVNFAVLIDVADAGHKKVIEEAMNEFKELFKIWVTTFKKDDCEDDWGLFN